MAVKGWFDLTPEQRREVILNLHRSDINQRGLTAVRLTSLLSRFNLLGDEEIRRHFEEEKIRLPHPVSKEIVG